MVKSYLPSELKLEMSSDSEADLKKGCRVVVEKPGSQIGKAGVILDMNWSGRIKIKMDAEGEESAGGAAFQRIVVTPTFV